MRIVLWIFTAIVCLVPIVFIGVSYLKAPSAEIVQAQDDYMAVWKNYSDGNTTEVASLQGSNENEEFVRILSTFLNKSLDLNNRLTKFKNDMVIMIQPQKLASPQGLYELLEQQLKSDQEVQAVRNEYETAVNDLITKTEALDKKELKIDTVSFIEGVNENKPKDEKELQLYSNLSQTVKALLEFANTRKGYYQYGTDGFLHFTRPEDQAYYVKIMAVLATNVKQVEDLRMQNSQSVRKFVNDMSAPK